MIKSSKIGNKLRLAGLREDKFIQANIVGSFWGARLIFINNDEVPVRTLNSLPDLDSISRHSIFSIQGGRMCSRSLWGYGMKWLFSCAIFLPEAGHAAASFSVGTMVLEPCVPTEVMRVNVSTSLQQGQLEGDPSWSLFYYSNMSGPQLGYTRPAGWEKTSATDYTTLPLHSWSNSNINPARTLIEASFNINGCTNISRAGWMERGPEGVYLKVEGSSSWSVGHLQYNTTEKTLWSFNTSLDSNGYSSHSKSGTIYCSDSGRYNCDIMWPSKQVSAFVSGVPTRWFTTNYNSPIATGDFIDARAGDGWFSYSGPSNYNVFRYKTNGSWRVLALYAPARNNMRADTVRLPAGTFTASGMPRSSSWYASTMALPSDMRQSPTLDLTLSQPKPTCTANVPARVTAGNILQPAPGGGVRLLGKTNITVTCTNSSHGHLMGYSPGVIFSGAAGAVTTSPARLTTSTSGLFIVGRHGKQAARSCTLAPDRDDVLFDGKTKYLPSDGSMTWSLSESPSEVTRRSTEISWYVCAPGTFSPNPGPFSAKAAWSVVLN